MELLNSHAGSNNSVVTTFDMPGMPKHAFNTHNYTRDIASKDPWWSTCWTVSFSIFTYLIAVLLFWFSLPVYFSNPVDGDLMVFNCSVKSRSPELLAVMLSPASNYQACLDRLSGEAAPRSFYLDLVLDWRHMHARWVITGFRSSDVTYMFSFTWIIIACILCSCHTKPKGWLSTSVHQSTQILQPKISIHLQNRHESSAITKTT